MAFLSTTYLLYILNHSQRQWSSLSLVNNFILKNTWLSRRVRKLHPYNRRLHQVLDNRFLLIRLLLSHINFDEIWWTSAAILVFFSYSYIRIWLMLRKQNKIFAQENRADFQFQKEKRLTKTMFILLGVAFTTYFIPVLFYTLKYKMFQKVSYRFKNEMFNLQWWIGLMLSRTFFWIKLKCWQVIESVISFAVQASSFCFGWDIFRRLRIRF